jgi:uncharacterized small protein (DUF1192 family)
MLKAAILSIGLALVAAGTAQAAPAAREAGAARWFRYYDDRKQPVVTDTITQDHIVHGYDELTDRMMVIRHVDARPPLSPEEKAAQKRKAEEAAQRARDDKQLLRLYAGPADAERARNRQLDALQVRIDFNANLLATARQRRTAEAQRAATFERQGKPVPADVKMGIAEIDKQISATQAELNARKAEQAKIRDEFEPMIKRLAELTGKPAGTVPPPAAATGPAAAPPPH